MASTNASATATTALEARSIALGSVASLVTWVLGYAATYVIVAPDVRESGLHRALEAFGGEPATYEVVGWVFYNAHFVDTVFRDVPILGTETSSYVGGDGGFTAALYAIPIALLFVAGLGLARYRGATDWRDGVPIAASVLPGYLLASIAGVFLVEVSIGGATGAPDLLPAVVLAGVCYPLVFGGAGGVVGALTASKPRAESESDARPN
ncbi:hypothetical protein ACFQGT_08225 [Natrialbaceae archaeon GCM10025810]|uniref:hypothetical protein n=1 Tax=Halovalidus salilacus TaxID=3075124 RepID=UPI0036096ED0